MAQHGSGNLSSRGYEDFQGVVGERASESTPAWPGRTPAAPGSPNIIVVLVDDMGYSDIGPFGGEIDTPNLNEISGDGYRFPNYHTAPMCAPARAALLTGLNPHRAGFSFVPHIDPGYPNSTMELPLDAPTLAENLRAGGYATYMVGKWHLTLESKMHDGAEKSSWPLQRGFDRYYGCMDGFTSLFHPHRLIQDNSAVQIDEFPDDYYLTDDLTDRAIGMVRDLRANEPEKPFFLYFAHQAVHGPLQAKAGDLAKYRGRYDAGWDHVRSERFARQIADGLFPEGTRCAPRNAEPGFDVAEWDSLSTDQQLLFARYMEAYAASVDSVDQSLGRITDELKAMGEYENTIIVFTSDNGGTAEGGATGTRSYFSQFSQYLAVPERWQRDVERDPELIGGPQAFVHYPRGWAYASNTPFRQYKTHTYAGGLRVPFLLSWPAGLPRTDTDNGLRTGFGFVTDVAPTLLELAGVDPLRKLHGRNTLAIDGYSRAAVLRSADAAGDTPRQYLELNGRRAYFSGKWKALTPHANGPAWAEDEWELYDVSVDPTEQDNIAAENPGVVAELAGAWKADAWMNTVFPLNDDGSMSRQRPDTELLLERPVTLRPGAPTLERYRSAKLTFMRSVRIELDADGDGSPAGVLVAHGDQGGGYVLYLKDERLHFSYNEYGTMHRASTAFGPGVHRVVLEFRVGSGLSCDIAVLVDGVQEILLDSILQLCGMSPFTGISIGLDRGGPVDWELSREHGSFRFSGTMSPVRYVPGPKSTENPEVIVALQREVARMYE